MRMGFNMTEEEKNFAIKVNVDKAKNKVMGASILIGISLLTYVLPLIFGEYDFGILFEVASLLFLLIARHYMTKYDVNRAKRYIICSMVAIGWILIYDILLLVFSIQDILDFIFTGFDYLWAEIFTILYLFYEYAIYKDLVKVDNPIEYKESTDWFYENYEKDLKR